MRMLIPFNMRMKPRTPKLFTSIVNPSPFIERAAPLLRMSSLRTMKGRLPLYLLLSVLFYYVYLYSVEVTPPPTPSPIKGSSGKKRAIAVQDSDDDDVFVPRYDISLLCSKHIWFWWFLWISCISPTRDSPKKARAKGPSTPSKILKSSANQAIFDGAVYVPLLIPWFDNLKFSHSSKAQKALAAPLPVSKGDKGKGQVSSSKSPTKAEPP